MVNTNNWHEEEFQDGEKSWQRVSSIVREHLNKVKQALFSRSNMEKALKEEAVRVVSEMDSVLNELRGMFLYLECTLEKALTAENLWSVAEKESARRYSELLATSPSSEWYLQKKLHPVV